MNTLAATFEKAEATFKKQRARPRESCSQAAECASTLWDTSLLPSSPREAYSSPLPWLARGSDSPQEPTTSSETRLPTEDPLGCATTTLAPAPVTPATFYARHHRWPGDRALRHLREHARAKCCHGVLAAPFESFALQDPALRFADGHELAPELRVFSVERSAGGGRYFVVTAYEEFWRHYRELVPAARSHYEIIREGQACHLYFDLEYKVEFNSATDGQQLVNAVISLAAKYVEARFGVRIERSHIVELDSTTDAKFSRHLIVRLPGKAFRSNADVGHFVAELCCGSGPDEPIRQSLVVRKDAEGGETCFVDRGVYTRNRAFRLMLSSKAGKSSFLQPTGRFAHAASLEQSFYESLICNVDCEAELLACYPDAAASIAAPQPRGCTSSSQPADACPGPVPQLEDAILVACNQGPGPRGHVRSRAWRQEGRVLLMNVAGNRFCGNAGRQHRSNGIFYVADLERGVCYQMCHDPDCRGYRSPAVALPPDVIRWWAAQPADVPATHTEPGVFDDGLDDACLLAALQQAEASIVALEA